MIGIGFTLCFGKEFAMTRMKGSFKRLAGIVLMLAMIVSLSPLGTTGAAAAEKKTTEYFAYRVDVMDAKKSNDDCVAVQVMSSIDGCAYIYIKYAGEAQPSVKEVTESGYKTLVTANEETESYGHIYWLNKIEVGKKYDIYIVFEDGAHKTYGPFAIKKWVAKYFPAGNGSKKKPYQIWTPRHLYNMSAFTGDTYKNKYFKVMQDIDLSESIYSGRVTDYASTFFGTFDGGGKNIRGLKGRLFDHLDSTATVKNVYLSGADGTYNAATGGLEGLICETNKGIVEKCVVYDSELECSSAHGIICGTNYEYGIVRNCASIDCRIYSTDSAGGIVGRNEGKVEDCYSNISIKSNTTSGGIVGMNFGGTVEGCVANPTFTRRTLPASDQQAIGGIVGLQNGSKAAISDCVSLFVPENPDKMGYVGSIWGSRTSSGLIENAKNNVGGLKYKLEDIVLTDSEKGSSKNEEYLTKLLDEKKTRWVSYHGESADTIKEIVNPVKKQIDGGKPKGKNKVSISGLSFKLKHAFQNETAAYNKKFKISEVRMTVTSYQTPAKAKINKVSVDQKNRQVKITWEKVKKAEGYEVYVASWKYASVGNRWGEYELEKQIVSANAADYTDQYLSPGMTYFYKVRAFYTVNGVKVYGPFSDVKEAVITKE